MFRLLFSFTFMVSIQTYAAIFGIDQRKDISELSKDWGHSAQAVSVSLPTHYLKELDRNHFYHDEHSDRHYGQTVGICKDERFFNQKSFGHCTSFLIHPKILVSAGHCLLPAGEVSDIKHPYCDSFSFWLGYNDKLDSVSLLGSKIPKKNVVRCKKVIYATNSEKTDPNDHPVDFAIFELEDPVTHIKPLKIAKKTLSKGELVTTIGHPHGLPAKQSGLTKILKVYETTLSANMDTLSGNSGGPAFNSQHEVVGILINGHQHDTYQSKGEACDKINRCNEAGTKCDKSSDLENSNLLLRNKVWLPYVEKFLKGI